VREELLFQTGAPELVVQIPALLVLDGRCCIRERGRGKNKKIKSDRHMNEEKSKIFADEIDQRQHLVGIHGFSYLTWGKKQCVVDGGAAIRKKRRLICLSLAFLAFIVSNEEEGRICPSCNWNIIVRTERAHLHGHYFEVCALSYVFKLLSLIFLLCLTIIFIYF
jgi:hypothetical protein